MSATSKRCIFLPSHNRIVMHPFYKLQNNLYLHTKYENMAEVYLYHIWEFLKIRNN
jgi:hypothetical protein